MRGIANWLCFPHWESRDNVLAAELDLIWYRDPDDHGDFLDQRAEGVLVRPRLSTIGLREADTRPVLDHNRRAAPAT